MAARGWLALAAALAGAVLLGAAAARATQTQAPSGVRLEVRPTLTLHYVALNLREPLFRNNPRLARALNYAVDRQELIRAHGTGAGIATDRLLPYFVPGRSRSRLYPLARPNIARARALAEGHTRGGKAVVGVFPGRGREVERAAARSIRTALELLGIEAEVKEFERPTHSEFVYYDVDVVVARWTPELPDPAEYVSVAWSDPFRGARVKYVRPNFDDRVWNRRFAAASALGGGRRDRAYDRLDRDLMRLAPPVVPYMVANARFLVANRIGCFTYHAAYGVDLAAACMSEG